MNFFLDANILYKDPFLRNNFNHQLIEIVRMNLKLKEFPKETFQDYGLGLQFLNEDCKIYISYVAYEEAKNNYFKQIKDKYKQLKSINRDINWYMGSKREITTPFTEEECKQKFDDYYNELITEGIVTIIKPPEDITQKLILRAIQKTEPFFNNDKNEFRDAVIWLSYATYAETKDLENCYFITDNVTDFCRKLDRKKINEKKSDKEKLPQPLHPNLIEDSEKFVMYRSSEGVFTYDSKFRKYREEYVEITNLYESSPEAMSLIIKLRKLKDSLDVDFLQSIIALNMVDLKGHIESVIENKVVNGMDIDSLYEDIYFEGDLLPHNNKWFDINVIDIKDKEIVDDAILVSALIGVPYSISVYGTNPIFTKETVLEYLSDEQVTFIISTSFFVDLKHNITNFECDTPVLKEKITSLF
ncbi:PIN domain-containing protein [Bacillus mojavensis]|uniref:PIN domain-containing protein n=1 Tax=Bacillus mojavensis TaxID=72360 RepID=UPI0039A2BB92